MTSIVKLVELCESWVGHHDYRKQKKGGKLTFWLDYQFIEPIPFNDSLRIPFNIRCHMSSKEWNQPQSKQHKSTNTCPWDRPPRLRRRRRRPIRRRLETRKHKMLLVLMMHRRSQIRKQPTTIFPQFGQTHL